MLERTEITAATSKLYDQRYAGDYMDTDAYSVWGHSDLRTRQVLDTLSHVRIRPRSILDYGCGVGAWLGPLSSAYPDAQFSGVDISKTAIEKARAKFPKYHLESFDGLTAPFADEQFDLVFSYHVLEHVDDIDASIKDIARLLKPGGYAAIIFPCGNEGSFLDRTMHLISNSRLPVAGGRTVLFFETADGHVRRMTSNDTVAIFEKNGLVSIEQLFSGHLFGTIDWLCRGTGPAYINKVFSGQPAIGQLARLRLDLTRRLLLAIHRLILRKSLDLTKKRNPLKQVAVFAVKQIAKSVDRMLSVLTSSEWRFLKHRKHGTAQYLVFRKT
jgi:ubiquinone/menaquinone biosynthesis C-methylase UbiE